MTSKSVHHKPNLPAFEQTSNSFASRNPMRYRSITGKDETPLTDEQIQTITKRALKDMRQRQPNIEIVDFIKGKPYCLKLGEKEPTTDNFKTFYNNFYSTIYNGKGKVKGKDNEKEKEKGNQREAKENWGSRSAVERKHPQFRSEMRESIKSKFTKNLDVIIDRCNKVMTTSAAGSSLYTIAETKPKRVY